ncbi:MAG TPA: hypothetical protein VG452_13560 [Egibacteraceae bacterium]|nr:hypothetical protein [Egibacteraceae bacterium]
MDPAGLAATVEAFGRERETWPGTADCWTSSGSRAATVHLYWEVDPRKVNLLLHDRLGDFDRFAGEVTANLDRLPSDDR